MRGLFYVSFQYLKALHYFFFFLSLLSMVLGVVFFDIF